MGQACITGEVSEHQNGIGVMNNSGNKKQQNNSQNKKPLGDTFEASEDPTVFEKIRHNS